MTVVHLVVPEGIDDPARPSGGNTYDRRLREGLDDLGWAVHLHRIPGAWPTPDGAGHAALDEALATVPDGVAVIIDGLIASAAPESMRDHAGRIRLVALVHLPLGVGHVDSVVAAREHAALSTATTVVATGPWTRDWLVDVGGLADDRVLVAEPGVDPATLAASSPSGRRLLCVGAIAPHKGQDVLVDALARSSDLDWDCRLVGANVDAAFALTLTHRIKAGTSSLRGGHAGSDPASCWSRRAARLSDRVALTGPLTGSQLAAAYRDTDLLVVPSRIETYGLVVLEALARGIPVLTTTAGGLPHALGVGEHDGIPGILVPPDDPAALASALRAWLTDEVLRQRLRAIARDRRPTLRGWAQTVDRISRVVSEVAA